MSHTMSRSFVEVNRRALIPRGKLSNVRFLTQSHRKQMSGQERNHFKSEVQVCAEALRE